MPKEGFVGHRALLVLEGTLILEGNPHFRHHHFLHHHFSHHHTTKRTRRSGISPAKTPLAKRPQSAFATSSSGRLTGNQPLSAGKSSRHMGSRAPCASRVRVRTHACIGTSLVLWPSTHMSPSTHMHILLPFPV